MPSNRVDIIANVKESPIQKAGFKITVACVKGGNVPIDPYSIPSNPQGTNRDDPISFATAFAFHHYTKV